MKREEIDMSVHKYLIEEGMIDRSRQNVLEEIGLRIGFEMRDQLASSISESSATQVGNSIHDYEIMSHPIGNLSIYDFIRSGHYAKCAWQLGETFEQILEHDSVDILDIGCATGLEACFIAEQLPDAQVIGLDLAQGMIERANHRKQRRNIPNVQFVEGDREEPPFEPYSFDMILYSNCLTEGTDAKGMTQPQYDRLVGNRLKIAARLLRKKGKIILTQPANEFNKEYIAAQNRQRLANAGLSVNREKRLNHSDSLLGEHYEVMLTATKR